jgi:serine/threonine protein kinase
LRGGTIIGQGSFGCVYKPSLRCAAGEPPENNNVSKLIYRKNLEKEKGPDVLPLINASQDYFVYPRANCPFDETIQTNYNEMCPSANARRGPLHLLIMKDGGIEPDNVGYQPEDYYKFFEAFGNVFRAVERLHESGHVHHDIKPSNMLVKVGEDGSYKIRLIDFGLVRHIDADVDAYFDNDRPIYTNIRRDGAPFSRYSTLYDYYPPTTDIMGRQRSFFMDKTKGALTTNGDFWYRYNNHLYKAWRDTIIKRPTVANAALPIPFYLPKELTLETYGTKDKRGLVHLMYETLSTKEKFGNFMKNIDYYSIGISLLELIFLFFNITITAYRNPDKTIDYSRCRPLIRNDIMINSWSSPAQSEYENYEGLRWPYPEVLDWFKEFTEPEGSFLQKVYGFTKKLMFWDYDSDSLDNEEILDSYIRDILSSLESSLYVGGDSSNGLNPHFIAYLRHAQPQYSIQYLRRALTPINQQPTKRGRF